VIVSLRTGDADCDFPSPGINAHFGDTSSVASDGTDGWFINCCGPSGIERLRSDGTRDTSWRAPAHPLASRSVRALVLGGQTLYAGGPFGVEALAASTWQRLWLARLSLGDPQDYRPGVLTRAVGPNVLYVGGSFTAINGVPVVDLAALDPRTGAVIRSWSPPRFHSPVGQQPVQVVGLAPTQNRLFFSTNNDVTIHGLPGPSIGALDPSTGTRLRWHVRVGPQPAHVRDPETPGPSA